MKIEKYLKFADKYVDYWVWFIGVGAMFGSLILSDIMNLPPCLLCWWQRIFMYPIAFIMSVGILRKDKSAVYYVLPLAVVGFITAFYHSLLQWHVIEETVVNCSANGNVSCAESDLTLFGFVTIPFMSFISFGAILLALAIRIYLLRKAVKPE